ncbi:MAG: helix-turn-helix transcriptional regulator [Polyangiaceae bacterium]|nr:helix-turn-helix transcriptional regulator [Polyangiaceae bacterium]
MENTFGQQIRELRKAKGLTQRQLAERIEIDFTYLSKLENDRPGFAPSEAVIQKIAKELGADAEDLTLLARKIPEAIQETMTENPKAKAFLRSAGELTDAEWDRILEIARKKRKKG